ncbi:MAG: hypothetical protein ACE5D1_04880, partial [Fidelibacterota bacterium]
ILPRYLPDRLPVEPGILQTGRERGWDSNKITLKEPGDQEIVTIPDPEFRWATDSRSLHYLFYLYAEDGSLAWKTQLDTNRLRIPRDHLLQNNRQYIWGVDAILGPEITITSDLILFETRFDSTAIQDAH